MHERHDYYEAIGGRLSRLEILFDGSPKGKQYKEYFIETLSENELEMALHALCNFLLKSGIPAVAPDLIREIEAIHKAMGIDDDCAARLEMK